MAFFSVFSLNTWIDSKQNSIGHFNSTQEQLGKRNKKIRVWHLETTNSAGSDQILFV